MFRRLQQLRPILVIAGDEQAPVLQTCAAPMSAIASGRAVDRLAEGAQC
jgi:hypothetical protein